MIDSIMPSVSILLLVKNERHHLESYLPVLMQQQYAGPVEYVCIDSGSTDGSLELLRSYGITPHCIAPEEFHHGRTRNLAASMARNDILVLLSGDACPLSENWLNHLAAPFTDSTVGAVYGRQVPPASVNAIRARAMASEYPALRQVRSLEPGVQPTPALFRFSNANAAVRRSVWEQFRWNESLLLAEDQGMCYAILQAGMNVVYEPAAAVIHGHQRRLRDEFRYAFDNGASLACVGILNNPAISGEWRYGLSRTLQDAGHFMRMGAPGHALQCLLINAVKLAGVQLGKRESRLPRWLLPVLSETIRKKGLRHDSVASCSCH